MKWFKKLINTSCLCCGEIAEKDVKEIPMGEHILYELTKFNYLSVSRKRFETIAYRFVHNHLASYPLCIHCYGKVEAKWQEDKTMSDALLEHKKKKLEINECYEKLEIEIYRK